MTTPDPSVSSASGFGRSATWRWYICTLLLLATVVNYMDRLTANTLAVSIKAEFFLDNKQYGLLELAFGLAFAAGSLLFGWLVDRIGVYWLYPIALIGWSAMGFLTGLSRSFHELLLLRALLGLFEAGHFPCGLKTIQLLLAPRDRAMGSSMLQSGTALGAILAPQVIKFLLAYGSWMRMGWQYWIHQTLPVSEVVRALLIGESSWRMPFLVIGVGGCAWVLLWFVSIRKADLASTDKQGKFGGARSGWKSFFRVISSARFLGLAIMVVCINLNWHLFRVWLPMFLQESRGYSQGDMLDFTTFYYIAADAGALTAGFLSGLLARRGFGIFSSRMWVFAACCVLTTVTTVAAFLPAGPLLLAALLIVAFGGLGAYAAYYSLAQDLSSEHVGKVTGLLSTITWLVTAIFHPLFGSYLDRTKNYDLVIAGMGWLPMIALIAVLSLWNLRPESSRTSPPLSDEGEDRYP